MDRWKVLWRLLLALVLVTLVSVGAWRFASSGGEGRYQLVRFDSVSVVRLDTRTGEMRAYALQESSVPRAGITFVEFARTFGEEPLAGEVLSPEEYSPSGTAAPKP